LLLGCGMKSRTASGARLGPRTGSLLPGSKDPGPGSKGPGPDFDAKWAAPQLIEINLEKFGSEWKVTLVTEAQ